MDINGGESCSSSRSSPFSANGTGLNLLCSALDQRPDLMDSSNSSEASTSPSPSQCSSTISQRRASANDGTRDEAYWEKRRRNNDAAKRSREKRRMNDIVMEQRLMELTKENTILKNRLQQQEDCQPQRTTIQTLSHQHDSVIVAGPKYETASLPAPSITAYTDYASPTGPPSKLQAVFPQLLTGSPLLASGPSATLPSPGIPMLHLSHLQAAFQTHQYRSPSAAQISSGNGAFQPFQSSRDNITRRSSPDSSTSDTLLLDYSYRESSPEIRRVPSYRYPNSQIMIKDGNRIENWRNQSAFSPHECPDNEQQKPQSLLELLSTRRPSPLVPETRTDIHSGLANTPPRESDLKSCLSSLNVHLCTSKSDTDSMGSPNSNHSTTDSAHSQPSPTSSQPNAAIVKALNSRPSSKIQQQYMDRRRRNNEAAKRCRANRRAQFELRSKRAQQLEQENEELRKEMNRLKQELEQLKAMHAVQNAAILQQ